MRPDTLKRLVWVLMNNIHKEWGLFLETQTSRFVVINDPVTCLYLPSSISPQI